MNNFLQDNYVLQLHSQAELNASKFYKDMIVYPCMCTAHETV